MLLIIDIILFCRGVSKPVKGSSNIKISGSESNALPIETLCASPPDKL